jgi:sugar/nucleoside kinase (ribokinase family)
MAPTLFVFGDLCVDVIAVPASVPADGGDTRLEQLDVVCGGAAYNCAIAAVKAGATVEAIGITGDDDFGRMLVKSLERHGVQILLVQSRSDARTGTVISMASEGGERTLYSYRGVNGGQYGGLPDALLQRGDCVYVSGYSLQEAGSRETAQHLKRMATASAAICLLDPSFQWAASFAVGQRDFLEGLDLDHSERPRGGTAHRNRGP